jgi:hypothetical protein
MDERENVLIPGVLIPRRKESGAAETTQAPLPATRRDGVNITLWRAAEHHQAVYHIVDASVLVLGRSCVAVLFPSDEGPIPVAAYTPSRTPAREMPLSGYQTWRRRPLSDAPSAMPRLTTPLEQCSHIIEILRRPSYIPPRAPCG